jgi:hypothetical protein
LLGLAPVLVFMLTMGEAAAQARAPLARVGVFSLLGDTVQATWSDDRPRDTRIEKTGRDTLDFKGIGFDLIALRVARAEIGKQQPAPAVDLFAAPVPVALSDQRTVASGAERAELPDWIVKAVNDNKLSHVLLVTRGRGAVDARTSEGFTIGRGTVEGIGFYIDTLYEMLNKSTGAVSTGLLAPYVQIRLQLMEVQSGNIVAEYGVRDAFAYAAPDPKLKAEPWDFMPNTQKVRVLRRLVEEGMTRGLQALLKGGQ